MRLHIAVWGLLINSSENKTTTKKLSRVKCLYIPWEPGLSDINDGDLGENCKLPVIRFQGQEYTAIIWMTFQIVQT